MAKILVVDDDDPAPITEIFKRMIDALFPCYSTSIAHDSMEALDAVKRESPDLILLDYNMPRMNGYEFSRAVRTDPGFEPYKGIPIVGMGDFPEDKREYLTELIPKNNLISPIANLRDCINKYCR